MWMYSYDACVRCVCDVDVPMMHVCAMWMYSYGACVRCVCDVDVLL